MNHILQEDFEQVLSYGEWEELRGRSVFVTGATGLIGSLLVRLFAYANETRDADITIYPFVRSKEKAEGIYGDLLKDKHLRLITGDLLQPVDEAFEKNGCADAPIDYIFHGAAITTSKVMVERPVETIATSLTGTENVLKFAAEKKVRSMVYLSSMEMYGTFPEGTGDVTEDMLGEIDIKKIRSNYPLSKRMCENMCVAYHSEYGVPVKIARLAQTFGAGILPGENRVFAQFAKSAIKGEDIVLHTEGKSEGNYCYSADALAALILLLLKGEDAESYNVVNEATHTTIAQMAQMVAEEIAGGSIKVVFDIPKENTFGYAADTKLKLSAQKLRSLGWQPRTTLPEAYHRLVDFLQYEEQTETDR